MVAKFYKMAIGSSAIYAAYWDTSRKYRTYIPNEDCVRLKMNSIINGINTRQEYMLKGYAVILRDAEKHSIKNVLYDRNSQKVNNFTLYFSNRQK